MITIDGSIGEGGGQILRSSLTLSMITGKPFSITNIRAGRKRPGLMRQHLTAVNAATAISNAEVTGDSVGSRELTFKPGRLTPGDYNFSVGTAGSTTLVLQTVLPALMLAEKPSVLSLEGGTHNPYAPPFPFLERVFLPIVNKMGPQVSVSLEQFGFYPAGGGKFSCTIEPTPRLKPFTILARGDLVNRRACALIANLDRKIGSREVKKIQHKLNWTPEECVVEEIIQSKGPGNIVFIELEYEHITEMFTGFGEINKSAEYVAESVINQYRNYIKTEAPIGEYLTDQLMLLLALAQDGAYRCVGLSKHAKTHIQLIEAFLDKPLTIEQHENSNIVSI